MIDGNAKETKCIITFYLSNGISFELSSTQNLNNTNYITTIKLEEKISASNNIPVGVNTSNVLDLEIISNNRALIPDNEDSIYYGYMNNTAIIEVKVTEADTVTNFGKYFVNSWKSSNKSDSPNKVFIQAIDLMGVICKQNVPDVNINKSMYIKDYIISVINELNKKLDINRQVLIDTDDIKFDAFPVMQFCNIDTENINNCFNNISQSTLTNIFTDRDGKLKTDYNCDDIKEDAKYKIEILTGAECGTGMLVDYDGVKVKYSNGDIKDIEIIASLYDKEVIMGDNEIKEIALGQAVYKINRIECIAKDPNIFVGVKSATYNKNKLSLILDADNSTKVNILVYGQRLDNTELIQQKGGDNVLELNNKIIPAKYISKYIDGMLTLIGIKNNSLTITGYFKPSIQLTDIIYVDIMGGMNVSGYYKVIGLEWELGSYSQCTMTLIKTFESYYDINSVADYLNELLEKRLYGIPQRKELFIPLSKEENDYINEQLTEPLEELREKLYGGE